MSSLISAIKDLDAMLPTTGSPALAFPLIWHTITSTLHTILPSQRDMPTPLLPNSPDQLWSSFARTHQDKIQHTLSEYFYREQHQALAQDPQTNIFDRYRLIALTHKNTALIYNTLPTSRSLALTNNEIHQLTLFHSGLSLPYSVPGHCLLCSSHYDPRYTSHAMSCSATRRNNVTARHEYMVKAIHLLALEAHAHVKHEPRLGLEHTNRHPDLLLMFHTGESRFIDVTIRHGPTPNRLTQHMDEQKLLASACQAKQAMYRGDIHCFDESVDFKTGAASTFGTFSADLENIIEQLKIMYHTTSPEDTSYPFRVKANIAFAIQRGNAKILRDFAIYHKRLIDSPQHLRERANNAILAELNSDHVNDAASEAITSALRPKANSPLYVAEIDDFDDGLDIDDLMLENRQPAANTTSVTLSRQLNSHKCFQTPSRPSPVRSLQNR